MSGKPKRANGDQGGRKLIHEILRVGLLQCNCHVVGDPVTREAIVIDPGDEVERVLEVIAKHHLKVRAILITHAHVDHVGGLRKMREATGAPVMMHERDLGLYSALDMQASWLRIPPPQKAEVDEFLQEGRRIRWADYEFQVMHTPGHTEGSVCLYLPKRDEIELHASNCARSGALFGGDTLFAGSIGRTDFLGGSMKDMITSLHTKVLMLPDETVVFPGHGASTTIGEERESNPFLQQK
ncbi:MAG TPA: MBL fold metallo-hydrolase [Candidatus Acidoferrales bacterium]|nr:MBL fold metallo-hydrolase [Candidatus Acidoferrales bacterium]